MKRKILVKGPALSQTGYGEQTRFALRSLKGQENKYDIYIINTDWGRSNWIWEDNDERRWIDEMIKKTTLLPKEKRVYDMSLQVTIPNEWERITPYDIGYTAGVETTKISKNWIKKANEMNKVIFVSSFSEHVFTNTSYDEDGETLKSNIPTSVVNYAVRDFTPKETNLDLPYDFNFLACAQWGPRKNLDNLIRWFLEEFKDEEVGLVLKTNLVKNCVIDRDKTLQKLQSIVGKEERKCKIHLIHGYMTDEELTSLYTNEKIKALVTTTHGEGFGLPVFEAANHAMPVVAPDWSGYCDFLYAPVTSKNGKTKNKPMFAKVDFDLIKNQDRIYKYK